MDLFDLVAKITLDKSEYDQGIDDAETKGKGFGDKLKGVFGTVGKAGAGMAAGAVAAGAAIYGMATKSAAASDRIDKMSQKLGLSRKAFQEFDFIASQSGTSVESMRGGMKTLLNQMNEAASGTEASAEAFSKLGVSVTDADGNMRSQEDVLFDTIAALQGMEEGAEKTTLANQLLGKSGMELAPLINGAAGSLDEMRKQANDLGLVLSDDTIDAGVKFTDTVDQVQRSLSAIGTEIGTQVMPIVQNALQFVLDHMPEIRAVVSTVFDALGKYVDWFVNIINTYFMPIFTGIVDFIKNVFAGDWTAAWESIKGIFTDTWNGITGFFTEIFQLAADAIGEIDWEKVGTDIWDFIKTAFDTVSEWATETFGFIVTAIGEIDWEKVGTDIWDTIVGAFATISEWATETFNFVVTAVGEIDWAQLGTDIFDKIKSIFLTIGDTFKPLFEDIVTKVKEINWLQLGNDMFLAIGNVFLTIGDTFKGLFDKIVEKVKEINWLQLGNDIFLAIGTIFLTLGDTFKALFEGAVEKIKEIDWLQLGRDIFLAIGDIFLTIGDTFKGLFEGAVTKILEIDWLKLGSDIWESIKSAFSDVLDFFTGLFDFSNIHIKMPKFDVEWHEFGPISLPTVSVTWEAKAKSQPYMFSGATLFGAGEAGDEILYGRSSLMEDIRSAVGGTNDSMLYDLLSEYLPEILERSNKSIVLDDGTLIGRIDDALGMNSMAYSRGA